MGPNNLKTEHIIGCEEEPIHIIGHVQSHGFLIAINPETEQVVYASENCSSLFNLPTILTERIAALVSQLPLEGQYQTLHECIYDIIRHRERKIHNPFHITIDKKKYNAIFHWSGDYLVLELEPATTVEDLTKTHGLLGEILLGLNTNTRSLNNTLQTVADKVKELLGYDRVMIYKFWEDWHGEVVAEAKEKNQEPFLGLHYPASDIPQQARELYVKNPVRIIADVSSSPVPIRTVVDEPLDLSYAQVRAVSPIHIEYLKNMGVMASYSISLISEGKLWGLIACHHSKPSFIDFEKRRASEVISQQLSSLLLLKKKEEYELEKEKYLKVVDRLELYMREDWNAHSGISKHETTILDMTSAHGAAIVRLGEITLLGTTPSEEEVGFLVDWFSQYQQSELIFYTTKVSRFLPGAKNFSEIASGILIVTVSRELKDYIIWFKPEQITKVSWAGKNNKELTKFEDGSMRLSPRKSFEKWEDEVRNTSVDWSDIEIGAALKLREKIQSLGQLKSDELGRLNSSLKQAYEELDAFSYTLAHDLKTPLSTIRGYLELFMENEGFEENPLLSKVLENTELMNSMSSTILNYSKLGVEPLELKRVKISPILSRICAQIEATKGFSDIVVDVPEDCVVQGNEMMLYQVFLNLIDNAVKYLDPQRDPEVKVTFDDRGEEQVFKIADNGLGIASDHLDRIFELFKRGGNHKGIEGSGVGLAIVKKIIEKHRAAIWAESELGKGSVFHVVFKK